MAASSQAARLARFTGGTQGAKSAKKDVSLFFGECKTPVASLGVLGDLGGACL
jgi:hypothetical protein